MGAVLRAHPVRGESYIQRNANGEVATGTSFWINVEQSLKAVPFCNFKCILQTVTRVGAFSVLSEQKKFHVFCFYFIYWFNEDRRQVGASIEYVIRRVMSSEPAHEEPLKKVHNTR